MDRPTALTATLISASLSCNAVAGLLIYIGGRRTKKKKEVERRLRVALEKEAWERMQRRRDREMEEGRADGTEKGFEEPKASRKKSHRKIQEKSKKNHWKSSE